MTSIEKKFIKQYTQKYKSQYVLYLLLVILMSLFSICSILSLNNFLQILFDLPANITPSSSELDKFLNNIYGYFLQFGKKQALIIFVLLVLGIYFLKDVFTYLSQYQIGCTRNKIIKNIRQDLFNKFLLQDISFINKFTKGDLLTRISSDIIDFDETILKSYQTIINSIVTVVLYLTILFYIDPFLTLIALILFPSVVLLTSMLSRKLRSQSKKLQKNNAIIVSIAEQTLNAIRIIQAFSATNYVQKQFNDFHTEFVRLRNKVYRLVDLAHPQSEFFASIAVGIILFIGSYKVLTTNTLSSGMFIVYLILFILIIKPAKDTSTAYYNLKRGSANLNRIIEIIFSENIIKEPINPVKFPSLQEGIRFDNVNFAYNDSQTVLHNINLLFEKGKTTAIVGPSGSGKTTIIDLILKFYQLKENNGNILFDNVNINSINSKDLRQNISVVTQNSILFNNTVKNNITFLNNDYSFEQIKYAADIANATEFIDRLPQKFDTNLTDEGNMLSGGQKQRISIARAILKNSDILIFDEATSALDTENEKIFQQSLEKIAKNRTIIIIAHRLSTITFADKIVVLSEGQIKESGTHTELYNKKGIYYNLCKMQQLNN